MSLAKVKKHLFDRVDPSSIVFFRILFGVIMMWKVWDYFAHGLINKYWVDPAFHFTYYGFGWIEPLTQTGMMFVMALIGIAALFISLGFMYRISTTAFFVLFSYTFLIEQARYLNHFYLVILISFLLIFIPANKYFSLDAYLDKRLREKTVPAWSLWILRAQMAIPYIYGGIVKLNSDWLKGEPMRTWMSQKEHYGSLFGKLETMEWFVYLTTYWALALDLLIVPLLLWKKTRPYAFAFAILFNVMNSITFNIDIFPWFMLAGTLLFFDPDWPKQLIGKVRGIKYQKAKITTSKKPSAKKRKWILAGLSVFFLVQLLVPFRHVLYPGSSSWTGEGERFAWQMMLRSKGGTHMYKLVNTEAGEWGYIDPRDHLVDFQLRELGKQPDMMLQYAHFLADMYENVEVYVETQTHLNGRDPQPMIDPTVNLATEPRTLRHNDWILPLEQPLKN